MTRGASFETAGQQIRNLWSDPQVQASYGSSRVTMASQGRWVVSDTSGNTGDYNPAQRLNLYQAVPSPGPVTVLVQMRGSYSLSVGLIWNGGDPGTAPGMTTWQRKTTVPASPTTWVWVRMTLPANINKGPQSVNGSIGLGDGTTKTTNDWFEVRRIMIVSGTYAGEYGDGSIIGWKWDGTAGSSSSVGYPYSLTRAAGGALPLLSLGSTPASGGVTYSFTAQTEYTVYSVQSDTSYVPNDGFWQANGGGSRTSRLMANATTNIQPLLFGVTGANGTTNHTVTMTDTNVYAVRLSHPLTLVKSNVNAGPTYVGNSNGVATSYADRIYVGSRDGIVASVVTSALLVYAGLHADQQVVGVSKWLALKYGITSF